MTSPPTPAEVACPRCGRRYVAYFRPSINLSLGEEWTDEEIEEATTATCPDCGERVGLETLTVDWASDESPATLEEDSS